MMRPFWVNLSLLGLSGLTFLAMVALGVWQLQRLGWKLDLIEQIETRAYGAPVAAAVGPAPEYLRVHATGSFRHDLSLRVKAVTELGGGSWLLTPLATDTQVIWVNRGFVPTGAADLTLPEGTQDIEGFVRLSRDGGTLLERNRPESARWVSADLAAMSTAQDLAGTAPYYIDALHMGAAEGWPRGGLTRLSLRNSHLSYALTWFAMAALFAGAMVYVIRDLRRGNGGSDPRASEVSEGVPPKAPRA